MYKVLRCSSQSAANCDAVAKLIHTREELSDAEFIEGDDSSVLHKSSRYKSGKFVLS